MQVSETGKSPHHRIARACTRCRSGKTRCRPGSEPDVCHSCERAGLKCSYLPTRKERSIARRQASNRTESRLEHQQAQGPRNTSSWSRVTENRAALQSEDTSSPTSDDLDHLRKLYSDQLLQKAVDVFFQHFYTDIFFSLHEPSVRSSAESGTLKPILAIAIIALAARFIPELVEEHGSGTAASDYYADSIRATLLLGADKPSLEKIHALLFLSYHEWGSGRGATAFIYIGLAIRVGLLLRTFRKQTPLAPPFNKPVETRGEFVVEETRVRVWWSMYSMECLLCSGRHKTRPTYDETDTIDLPCAEQAFLWGEFHQPATPQSQATSSTTSTSEKANLVLAVRNWNTVHRWVSPDGAKKDTHPPWSPGSRFDQLRTMLGQWESQLSPKLRYDKSSFRIHNMSKQAGSYGFLHLVHCASVIFLHREYLQFFPDASKRYSGRLSTNLQVSDADAPAEGNTDAFWEASLEALFTAASRVTEILQEMEASGALMITPFVGFAAFTAATVNMYLAIFGWVCPSLSANARQRTESDVRILKRVAAVWPVTQQWYATILKLYDSYKLFHMGNYAEEPGLSGNVIETFHSFDLSLKDYGQIKPQPDDMAAIIAAKDDDGYRHGLEGPRYAVDILSPQAFGQSVVPDTGQDGYWDAVTDEFLNSIISI